MKIVAGAPAPSCPLSRLAPAAAILFNAADADRTGSLSSVRERLMNADPRNHPRPQPLLSRRSLGLVLSLLFLTCPSMARAAQPPLDVPQEAPAGAGPLTPAESMKHFHVADDLQLEQVLAEPVVAQPVFLNFDERGRMWVVQYRQYPWPAGLKMLSRDSVYRVVYDKVPPPPPNHFKGADKITIHEDSDGDGIFDKHKTFVDGLNVVTSVERGRGGVWVLNPPYLLFYPDANNDDVPDGDPVVHLSGFGLEDGHSVVNSLRWGPDGWLYSSQGSTVTANIIRPGLDTKPIARTVGQQIWRYHPATRRFEVFAEGGGNAFGCEIDSEGRIFSGHNGGDTRGFHYDQGTYLQKGFDKHGPLSNPYAFGYFPAMPHHSVARFTHNFVLYDGGALPGQYAGHLFGVEPIQGRIVLSEIAPDQSSFRTRDISRVLWSDDRWFRPVDIKTGPDGALYICDWYDQQVNHFRNHEGKIDPSNGRVYRLKGQEGKTGQPFDLSRLSSLELAGMLNQSNKWFRQTALRVLADRKDRAVVPILEGHLKSDTGQLALESLWALNLTDDTYLLRSVIGETNASPRPARLDLLAHRNPFVRLWTVRLLCDAQNLPASALLKLVRLAQTETSPEVRKQLASSAARLPAEGCLPLVRNLFGHDDDAADNRIPLMLWWAIETKCEKNRDDVLRLFDDPELWARPLVENHILERLMRRFALAGTRPDLLACARLLEQSPSDRYSKRLMAGFEAAFKGRSVAGLPERLVKAMERHGAASDSLRLRQGDPAAVQKALASLANQQANSAERLGYLQVLSEIKLPESVPLLLQIFEGETNQPLRKAALGALQVYSNPEIGEKVVAAYPKLNQELQVSAQTLLASRPAWLLQLAQAVERGQVAPEAVPINLVRQARNEEMPELVALANKIWPARKTPTSQEMNARIREFAGLVRGGEGDPYNGRTLFQKTCGACHTLFGQGGRVGPDLTGYQRTDLDNMLLSIVHPNAEIREGYETWSVETTDGREMVGFMVEQDKEIIVLRGLDDQSTTLARKDIKALRNETQSLMPEGLLDALTAQEVRDLFGYLRSTQPLVGSPPAKVARQ